MAEVSLLTAISRNAHGAVKTREAGPVDAAIAPQGESVAAGAE